MVRVKQGKKTQVTGKKGVSKPEKTPESHPHQCSTCGARFKRKKDLDKHNYTHSGSKPFQCSQCSASFAFNYTLTRHLLVHSKVKPHKCSQCSLSFARMDALNHHVLLHSQTKEFSCPDCPKQFAQPRSLALHQKSQHSNDKKYSCSECPKKFALRIFLYRHLKSHGILTPYSCSISGCDESFRLKQELLIHEATHNGNGDESTKVDKSSSIKTTSEPGAKIILKVYFPFNARRRAEEIEDEQSPKKKKNGQVRKRVAVDNDENEPAAKKRKIKATKVNSNNDENDEEEEECEFFPSKPYWCFSRQNHIGVFVVNFSPLNHVLLITKTTKKKVENISFNFMSALCALEMDLQFLRRLKNLKIIIHLFINF